MTILITAQKPHTGHLFLAPFWALSIYLPQAPINGVPMDTDLALPEFLSVLFVCISIPIVGVILKYDFIWSSHPRQLRTAPTTTTMELCPQ